MSLRTKSRMPASTSEAAARSVSSLVDSIFSGRMAFIGCFPCFASVASAGVPPHERCLTGPSGLPILAASRPICGNAGAFAWHRALPTLLETGGNALVGDAERGLRDRAGDIEAADDFLFGADPAQPLLVRCRQRLAGGKAGAGIGEAELCGLLGGIAGVAGRCRHRRKTLGHVVAVLEGKRILIAQFQRFAHGRPEPALVLR